MNKIYKVVWSKARQSYVVVSELAKRHGKASSRSILRVAMATALSMSFFGGQAVFAADSTVTGTEVTDSSMALVPNSIAKGNGAIATGSNTAAIGKGAVATGNNMTAEELQDLLNKKKTYETNLQNAQDAADASQQAYNKARSEYEEADVNNGIVDRANETIKGYQAQIDSTLKPNADTADAAYTKAKDDYDTLYNDFQNRISTIKTLDFTLYQDGSAAGYDLDKMATDLKTKTETGTSFNEPVDFYKSYIQNYIKAEGDLRQNEIISDNLSIKNAKYTNKFKDWRGWTTGELSTNECVVAGLKIPSSQDTRSNDSLLFQNGYFNYSFYNNDKTVISYNSTSVLSDTDYQSAMSSVSSYINTSKSKIDTQMSNLKSYGFDSSQIDSLQAAAYSLNNLINDNSMYALTAEHEQYLYEQARDAGNSTEALKHLSLKEVALAKYVNRDTINSYFDKYNSIAKSIFDKYETIEKNWVKTNLTDIVDATDVALKSMQDGLDAQLQEKKKVMEDALTAKNTADQALSDMQQKIKDASPTAEQLAEAAKYADKKKAMDDAAAKLEADKEALEKAQKDLSSLADLTHIGENAIAYGTDALVSGADAIGIGTDAIVTGTNAIGMGKGTVASGENATAVGQGSSVSGASATALGSSNTVTGDSSTAVGNGHTVLGAKSGAFGSPSNIYGDGSYSFGNNNTIGAIDSTTNKAVANQGLNTFVLGSDITTTANNAVILGAGSTDGGNNTVSVGSAKQTRRLVNVGDARLNATSTDAVTGRQLYTTNQNIAGFAADIKSNTSTISDLSKSVSSALDSVSSMSESFSSINGMNT